jgi:DNA modification methylase
LKGNILYYGDNLDVLRKHIKDETVDLIYLDPPFNSKATYNVLYKEPTGKPSEAQITAFEDTWHWTRETDKTFLEIVKTAPANVVEMMTAFRKFIGLNDVMAYLTMMCIRLLELRRVLKPTGSIYLHCDPTASHYLKILMDTVFGTQNFRSEIIWRRTNAHNKTSKQYGPIHDTILFYSRSNDFDFHPGYRPYTKSYIEDVFTLYDERGRFRPNMLTGAGTRTGESGQEWRGFNPTKVGRHWAIPASLLPFLPRNGKDMSTSEKLECLYKHGFIMFPKKKGGQPVYKQYVGKGVPYQDIWAYQPNTNGVLFGTDACIDQDVKYLDSDEEKLGYETQKPIGLLERIIETSSNADAIILDPFCGCGTTITAAQKLGRNWLGIDITHLAINLIKWRLKDMFGLEAKKDYAVIGEPEDIEGARDLFGLNRYQFQWWATSLINAKPYGDKKKGADTGIDGWLFFSDEEGEYKKAVVQVKGGKVDVKDIRDLGHVIDREKAEIGIFITLEGPTKPMIKEALLKGVYRSDLTGKDYYRIQILTIEELLAGKNPDIPNPASTTAFIKKAPAQDLSPTGELDL